MQMKNKFRIMFSVLLLCFFGTTAFGYKEIIMENINWKPVTIYKVVLDWEDFVVSSVSLSGNTLEELTRKVGGETSVNWVFFCPSDYSWCNNQNSTVFERIYLWDPKTYSTFWPDTGVRWIFGFDRFWNPLFVNNNLTMNWLGYNTNNDKMDQLFFWLSNFPVLLINWEDVISRSEEFMDRKMRTRWTKTFICSNENKNTVYMWSVWSVNLYELGPFVKKAFGCSNAINLDAWNSLAMVYDGRVIARSPRRQIMDAFVVLTREEYEKFTWITPPAKNIVVDWSNYELSQKDLDYVDKVYYAIHISSESTKKRVKVILRKMLSSNKVKLNQRIYWILKEILLRTYTIDRL